MQDAKFSIEANVALEKIEEILCHVGQNVFEISAVILGLCEPNNIVFKETLVLVNTLF